MKKLILLSLLSILIVLPLSAQTESSEEDRKAGLMAMIQTSQFDVGVPIWINSTTVLGPSLNYAYAEELNTDIGVGLFLKNYGSGPVEEVESFFSLRGGAIFGAPSEGENTIDFLLGTGIGADYFPHEKVSLGVEAQLNLSINDSNSSRFGNPGGVGLNTAAVIALSIYF